jgi:serine/threonine protein kinase
MFRFTLQVFSLEYCAPEVAQAVARGDRAMVASGAADMWAVGIIAYQLATGKSSMRCLYNFVFIKQNVAVCFFEKGYVQSLFTAYCGS